MADRPAARDEDRLPWLEPFGEGKRAQRRRPAARTALVGLLIAFFGVGLAVAFSLGARFARSPADAPAATVSTQPQRTASVDVPLAPPVPLPKIELIAPPPATEVPVVSAPKPAAAKPAIKKARSVKAKARKRTKRKPILRPFINIKRRPALEPAATPAQAPAPVRAQRTIPFTPRGRIIQLGTYSTQRKADAAWRSLTWRYPYLATKPKVISPTQPIGGYQYYRLRLGTENQAQSLVICQRLLARRQSCIVIY